MALKGFEKYLEDKIVERPLYGYAFDLTKGHVHVFDGEDFWIIERNEKNGLIIKKEDVS